MAEPTYMGVDPWQQSAEEEMRLKVGNQINHDPARAARIMNVAGVTGLPESMIDSNLEELEKRTREPNFEPEKWLTETPGFAAFAAENPYHLAVLKHDQDNLGWWERTMQAREMGARSGWAKVEMGRITNRHAGGDIREGDTEHLIELKELQAPHYFGAEGHLAKFIVGMAKEGPTTYYSMIQGAKVGGLTALTAGGVALGLGQLGPQAATPEEVLTVPAAMLMGFKWGFTGGIAEAAFGLERGFAYSEYLEMGLDPQTAKYYATAVGGVNAALESLSITRVVKYLPGVDKVTGKAIVSRVFKDQTFKNAALNYGVRYGEVLGIEVVTEIIQESVTMAAGELQASQQGIGTPMNSSEYMDRVKDIAVQTIYGAGIISSFGPTSSYLMDSRRAWKARENKALFTALDEVAKDSSLKKDVPAKFKQFVEKVIERGGGDTIRIDTERFREYWQEQGQDPDEVAKELGIENLESEGDKGVDLEIPMAMYAERIAGTQHHAGLAPDLKFSENDMSWRESESWRKEAPEFLKALEEHEIPEDASYEAVPEILDFVEGDLVTAGFDPDSARKQAEFIEYVFSTMAERNPNAEMTPLELFNRYLKRIEYDTPRTVRPETVDMRIDPMLDMLRSGEVPTQRDMFGPSLAEFIIEQGGAAPDPELEARDAKAIRGFIKEGGRTLDDIAEIAQEAGFLPQRDLNLLLSAIDQEIRGERVHATEGGVVVAGDRGARELGADLDRLAEFIDQTQIDLSEMSNEEVRAALGEGQTTLNQLDSDQLAELRAIIEDLTKVEEGIAGETLEERQSTMLARAQAMLPHVSDTQNFGEQTFTDNMRLEGTSERVTVTQPVQEVFNKAVDRRKLLKKLMDCVGG